MPKHWQHEKPAAAGDGADDTGSDSDSDSTQSSEPNVLGSEPEDTEEDMSDLGVAALDGEVNRLLQRCRRPTLASTTNRLESVISCG